jgi:hypothetical protein
MWVQVPLSQLNKNQMTREQYQGLNNIFKQFPVQDTPLLSFTKDIQVLEESGQRLAERIMKDLNKHKSKQ